MEHIRKRAPNFPYLRNVGPSRLELQKKALEEVARRKVAMEAAKARGEGTSSHGGIPHLRGIAGRLINKTKVRPIQTPNQNQLRGYNVIVEEA